MILVTGANGNLGRAIVEKLLQKIPATKVAVSVREPEKAKDLSEKGISVRQGDFDNLEMLPKAFEDAKTLVLISTSSASNLRAQQHKNAIDAAIMAGVNHIIYTSFIHHAGKSPYHLINNHIETEEYLLASGITYTIIREGLYLDYLPMLFGNFQETKKIFYPAGDGKVSFVLRKDIADGIVNILLSPGHGKKHYNFTSINAYSFAELVKMLSEVNGSSIEYVDIPMEAFTDGMRQYQLPEHVIDISVELASIIKENGMLKPDTQLETLLGRKPVDVKEFLKNTFQLSQTKN
jgi:NAD(P)H dehydrogenase (quinone)